MTLNTLPVALIEVPTIRPGLPPLKADTSDADKEKYALREQNRTTLGNPWRTRPIRTHNPKVGGSNPPPQLIAAP